MPNPQARPAPRSEARSRHHSVAARAVDRRIAASPNPEGASHAPKLAVELLCEVKRSFILFVFGRSLSSAVGTFHRHEYGFPRHARLPLSRIWDRSSRHAGSVFQPSIPAALLALTRHRRAYRAV